MPHRLGAIEIDERRGSGNASIGRILRKGLFVQILTFFEYLGIDIAGFWAAATADITDNINIFTLFLT